MMYKKKSTHVDFTALVLKLNEDSPSPHTVYIKEHVVREHTSDKPSGRTLFVINIPPYVDEEGIKNAFSAAGKIKSVQFYTKPNISEASNVKRFMPEVIKASFRVAYLVFSKVAHLDKALQLTELRPLNYGDYKTKCGLSKWIDEYNNSIFLAKDLKEKVETFMKTHDSETKKLEEKEKQLEQEDDDGWITVTKRGKVQSFARSENVEDKIMAKEEKNKKRKELKNFYRFQIRESKMKQIVTMRQKFEEDKRKIEQLKQSRRFKPF